MKVSNKTTVALEVTLTDEEATVLQLMSSMGRLPDSDQVAEVFDCGLDQAEVILQFLREIGEAI